MDDQVPNPPAPPEIAPPEAPKVVPPSDESTGKILAALGYLVWVIALIALLIEPYKADKFVRFHAVQALAVGVVVWLLMMIPVLGWLVGLAGYVCLIYLALKAWKGEMIEVPVVYDLVKSYI